MAKLEDVLSKLGEGAQEGGGKVVVISGGTHVLVGETGGDGTFVFTAEGQEIYDGTVTIDGVTVVSTKKPSKGTNKKQSAVEVEVLDVELDETVDAALAGLDEGL